MTMLRNLRWGLAIAALLLVSGCGYNTLQSADE